MKKIIIALSILLFSFTLNAQWQFANGPFGGDGRSFLQTPSRLFAGTNGDGILYSDDNGIHWYSSGNVGLTNGVVNCFIQFGADLYAGTNGGVFRSTNLGASWFAVNTGIFGSTVRVFLAYDNALLAGANGGIFKTTDSGASWTYIGYGIASSDIYGLISLNGALYAGTYGGGVFKSTDGGNSWASSNVGLINQNIVSLYNVGSTLYVGTVGASYNGVHKSTNFGASWDLAGLQNLPVYCLKQYSSILLAGTGAGVYGSTNSGLTWSGVMGLSKYSVYALELSGSNITAGTSEGFAVSINGGITWTNMGYMGRYISYVVKAGSYLYTGSGTYGVYASDNNGYSWFQANGDLPYLRIFAMTSLGQYAFAGIANNSLSYSGVFKTSNGGDNWEFVTGIPNRSIYTMEAKDSIVCVGYYYKSGSYSLEISTDYGSTFFACYSTYNMNVSDIEIVSTNNIFITSSGNVYRSTNFGTNFTQVYSNNYVYSLASNGTTLYAGGNNNSGVIMSTNNGANWVSIGMTNYSIQSMVVYQNNLIVSAMNNGYYLTNNNGATWHQKNQGITAPYYNQNVYVIDNYVYSGIANIGVWRRNLSEIISVQNISSEIPASFTLSQNYPNPFNPETNIRFSLPTTENVVLKVYNMQGKEVAALVNSRFQPGMYETKFNGSNLSSGVYFYKLSAGNFTQTRKMILLK